MLIARLMNLCAGVLLVGIGIYGLFDPQGFANYLNFHLEDQRSITEFMAAHGGIYLTLGATLCYCASIAARAYDGVRLVMVLSFGFALGRTSGLLLNGFDSEHVFWLGLEISSLVVGALLLAFKKN